VWSGRPGLVRPAGGHVEKAPPASTTGQAAPAPGAETAGSHEMKYMLLIYNNPATYQSWSEAKEQLAGYLTVDCESEQRAVEIAARWPDARYFAMEVRAVMHTAGTES